MGDTKEKPSASNDMEINHELKELGEVRPAGQVLTPEEDKRILRKIDMNLLPVMALSYLFQFLDKSALSYTAILHLRTDLKLVGSDYSWASSIYYFGYLAASYPAGWLMVRTPVGKMIAVSVLAWGAVLMVTAACFNSSGLLANRFFLGVFESAIGPGLSIIVAMWYKRSEQPLRHGAWFMGNVVAGILGGIVAYGVGHVQTIAPWKVVFLVFGAITVSWSAAIFFFLPDTPMNAKFLSREERDQAVARVEENMTGIKNNEWKMSQSIEAFLDLKVWFMFVIQAAAQIANGGVHSFGSIVIKGFDSANFPMILSMSSGNIGGFTKKTTVNAMIFIAYCGGNIIGPQLFFEHEAPSYPSGFLAMMICYAIAFSSCFGLRFYLIWENKRRDRAGAVLEVDEGGNMTVNSTDKTDKAIPQFRYVY